MEARLPPKRMEVALPCRLNRQRATFPELPPPPSSVSLPLFRERLPHLPPPPPPLKLGRE